MRKSENGSRIPRFFQLDLAQRIDALVEHGLINESEARALKSGSYQLKPHVADRMIENVIGVLGLPLGLGLNFLVNGEEFVVPLAVEEPSVVAGLSGAAKTARSGGGFTATTTDLVLIGQVQVVELNNPDLSRDQLLAKREDILNLANSLHPKMLARGGGAKDIEVHVHGSDNESGQSMLVLHLLVDTCDAMGANVVNGMCEGVSSLVEAITGGKVFLRILSNLTDRALVRASVRIPTKRLAVRGYTGDEVRDGIILANDLARVDPYRAATHNKGIMNGVDAVAIATGNDFRAIEAAAHAYAARDGRYRALTRWYKDEGFLIGEIVMPMKVGTVGGSLEANPTVRISHRLLGSPNAKTLASVMGAVGLAQNFAALRALSSAGIQQNHMTLHARSVTTAAKVPSEHFDAVVDALVEDGDIKIWKARDILGRVEDSIQTLKEAEPRSSANGKVILFGEHAVVYGRPALAVPVPLAVEARIVDADSKILVIPRWGVEQRIPAKSENPRGVAGILALLLDDLQLSRRKMIIEVFPNVPRAMGLGGSSAMAVAVIRALSDHYELGLTDDAVNDLAFRCEKAIHGTASGVDNTIATFGAPLLFQRYDDEKSSHRTIRPSVRIPIVVGISGKESLTANMVAKVASARDRQMGQYEAIFDQIAELTRLGTDAFEKGDLLSLGELMNMCHGFLNGMQLSTPELEAMIHISRASGAAGAKVTGAGGGGSIVAICPEHQDDIVAAIESEGFRTLAFELQ